MVVGSAEQKSKSDNPDIRPKQKKDMRRRSSSMLLTGLSLAALLAASKAFMLPTAAPIARAMEGGAAVAASGQQRGSGRQALGVTMATRRDVLRMPSSEPMVSPKEHGRMIVHARYLVDTTTAVYGVLPTCTDGYPTQQAGARKQRCGNSGDCCSWSVSMGKTGFAAECGVFLPWAVVISAGVF